MKWTIIGAVLLTAVAPARAGDIDAALTPADPQPADRLPYRRATLSLDNRSDAIIKQVSLRWRQGGPTMVYPVSIAPGGGQELAVDLPAGSPQQTYHLTFRAVDANDGALIARVEADITWPVELTTGKSLIDPAAYDRYQDQYSSWPARLRAGVFIAAVMFGLALAGTLLISGRRARIGAFLAITAAGLAISASMRTDLVEVTTFSPPDIAIHAPGPDETLYVLTARRTTIWHRGDIRPGPIYLDREQLAGDEMTIHARNGVTVPLNPHEIRLLRAAAP